jgi:RNA polymerase sigma-70 factor, ECF subfamily
VKPEVEHEVRAACDARDWDLAATRAIQGYGPELLGFLAARLRDRGAGGEAFSLFCEDLWRGLPGFAWRSSLRAWAYALARHAADRHADAAQRRDRRQVPLSQAPAVAAMAARVRTETLVRTDVRDRAQALRDALEPADRTLLVLRVDKDLSWLEIAAIMTYDGTTPDDASLAREAARLRKRFQLVKERLRRLALEAGLLEENS